MSKPYLGFFVVSDPNRFRKYYTLREMFSMMFEGIYMTLCFAFYQSLQKFILLSEKSMNFKI